MSESATAGEQIDLRPLLPPVRDQGARGTCLAFAITAAHEIARAAGSAVSQVFSEEVLHWGCKKLGKHKTGASFPSADAALSQWGQPLAHIWPYDGNRDEQAASYEPPAHAIDAVNCFKAKLSPVKADIEEIKQLLRNGQAVVIIVKMGNGFFTAVDGHVTVPAATDIIPDTHAILLVGFVDDSSPDQGHFIFRNSWGADWGDGGYGYLPYEYVTQYGLRAKFIEPLI